ncbi:hypothetical protein B7C51_07955 [Paenibacillus larvae subsp. pulvifaciens]|uniref:Uncharacterized protein n=1 Tax=Paenibacillus larvae subsp. pulvifaciens TaxID=1477 RepID=A0A1V0URW7_9BACL|nr:hypothetical protein B7C51_07955 [Paenibacillus larvae subsp. pulvifaciens]
MGFFAAISSRNHAYHPVEWENKKIAKNGGNFYRETFQAARQVVNGNNNTAQELLLMNFDNRQMTLF